MQEDKTDWRRWLIPCCSLAAVVGLAASLLDDFRHLLVEEMPGSDYKTVWASSRLMLHGQDAYSVPGLDTVYRAGHVLWPSNPFGHMPVYPPLTMALLGPLGALPPAASFAVWLLLSGLVFAAAITVLCRTAQREFGQGIVGQFAVIALCAIFPLVPLAMEMGNCSLIVSGFSIIALLGRGRPWIRWTGMGLALILKPHLALWALIAIALTQGARGRREAGRAVGFAAAVGVTTSLWLAARGLFWLEWHSYLTMLHSETTDGSMSVFSRESLATVTQITSVGSLTGWFTHLFWLPTIVTCMVTLTGAALIWLYARRAGWEEMSVEQQTLIAGACVTLGMLATYHRAHDGVLLLLLAPWGIGRLAKRWSDWRPWAVTFLLAAMSCSWGNGEHRPWLGSLGNRQAALADLLLTGVLLALLAESVRNAAPVFAPRASFRISWRSKSIQENSVVSAHIQHHQAGRR